MLTTDTLPFIPSRGSRDYELPADLLLENYIIPKGTTIRLITMENCGVIRIPPDSKDKRTGKVLSQILFRVE